MPSNTHQSQSDLIIIGAGIAGLVCALEALRQGKSVRIIDAQNRDQCGGLARVAFGGMMLVDTPEQVSKGIKDSAELAYRDWCSFANFTENDEWSKKWAKFYIENSVSEIYEYVHSLGVKYLPAVNWVERGTYTSGNTVPRYHILWGASLRLITQIKNHLSEFEGSLLSYQFETKATQLIKNNNIVVGCIASSNQQDNIEYYAEHTVIATGGFTGNLNMVKNHWPTNWKAPMDGLLNGTHPTNDGKMHEQVESIGGVTSNMQNMWNYAAGIPNPNPDFENHGLSLIPSRSALWVDHNGTRIGPEPLVAGFDTLKMCQQINDLQLPHSWQIMNRKIALKELAISGCEHNTAIRDRKIFSLLKDLVFGNKTLLNKMLNESDHFIIADDLNSLTTKMNQLTSDHSMSVKKLSLSLDKYDDMIKRGPKFWSDDQLRRIMEVRTWGTDRMRTCYPKPIQTNGPLIAVKLNLITRKCLGGIKTDLNCRVLDPMDKPIEGLLAIGEAAGFGGGGASGQRSLEGTFLSGCILTARQAARSL